VPYVVLIVDSGITPEITLSSAGLTLPLLVSRIRANHAHDALSADDAALLAPLGD
jgi:hypothetical protein